MADERAQIIHLSATQTQLLLAIFLTDVPAEAVNLTRRNAKSAEAARALVQMGYLVIGDQGAAATRHGVQELVQNGYIDGAGQTTEFGQQYYQKAIAALNESHRYAVLGELLTAKLHDF